MSWLSEGTQEHAALSMGTGGGKSLIPMVLGKLSGKKVLILTHTRGLQQQYTEMFKDLPQVKGMHNYACRLESHKWADQGVCTYGLECPHQMQGCYYFDAVRRVQASSIGVTNYAYYFASGAFKDRDLIVCDEAHRMEEAMESALTVTVPYLGTPAELHQQVESRLKELEHDKEDGVLSAWDELRMLRKASPKLLRAKLKPERWVVTQTEEHSQVAPIRAAEWLQVASPKVLLMSATLNAKHLDRLMLPDVLYLEYGSSFPAHFTPIRHLWTARINYHSTPDELLLLRLGMDKLLERYKGRRGIVFTASYKRALWLKETSKLSNRLLSHTKENVNKVVQWWRNSIEGVLITPSLVDGWDLREAEFIIVCKLPWPDTTDPVTKARAKEDRQWAPFTTMQTLVQECGRGTRSEEDHCDVWVLDDSIKWFWANYSHYAPGWFQQRYQGSVKEVAV